MDFESRSKLKFYVLTIKYTLWKFNGILINHLGIELVNVT